MGRPAGPIYPYGGGGVAPPNTYTPGGVTPAPPMPTPEAPVPPAPAPGPLTTSAAPAAGGIRYLTPAEQAKIMASLRGREGWTIVGGAAIPETKMGTNLRGASEMIPTGSYTVSIQDPLGNPDTIKITPDDPRSETPNWIASDLSALPKPSTDNTFEVGDGSRWQKDPNAPGGWSQIPGTGKVSNPDVDRSLALKAQQDQAEIDMRRANQAAGKGYMTDAERMTFDQAARTLGISEDRLKLERDKFGLEKLNADAKRQPEINEINARVGLSGAQQGLVGAQTAQTTGATDIAARKAGPEIEGIKATTEANLANAARTRQQTAQGSAPDLAAVGTGMNIYTRDPNTGALASQINQNYQPKTQAEVAARVGQLQTLATQKRDELLARARDNTSYTAEQAMADWNKWWDQNVEGQKASLAAAQEEVQYTRAKEEAATRTAAHTSALGAGTLASNAISDQAKRRVGPGFAQAAQQVMSGVPISKIDVGSALTYQAPDQAGQAADAVNQALKYISPSAAQATGMPMPNYASLDIQGGLDRMRYAPSFVSAPAPAPAPPAPAPPVPPPPPGPPAFKTGWPGSDPRLSGVLDPTQYVPAAYAPSF